MNRPTLSSFRALWPDEAMGICKADNQVRTYCNEAQQRLFMDPLCPDQGWLGATITMAFSASVISGSAYVTTPREVARLTDAAVCTKPIHIRNGFYEYLQYGAGLQPKTCTPFCGSTFQAYERDPVVTLAPMLPTAQKIRVFPTDPRDVGKRVLIQGKDQNRMTVLTTDPGTGKSAPGEYLVIASPFATSLHEFLGPLTGLQKDETFGPVQIVQVDPVTGNETALSVMQTNEASAYYRQYLVSGIPNLRSACCVTVGTLQLTAKARLDFVPVSNETDYLLIPNVPALIEESMSLRFNKMDSGNSVQMSAVHHGKALALLNGQLDAYEGKTQTAIKVPIFGSFKLRPSFR